MEKGVCLEDYGVNGKHKEIGDAIDNARFKGRVLEALKNLEDTGKQMKEDFKEHQKQDNVNFKNLNSFQDDMKGRITVIAVITIMVISALIGKVIGWF